MQATGGLLPTDGPFAAAWFNAVKGFAATAAGGAIALLSRQRGDYHAGTIADGFGSAYSRASGSAEQLAQLAARQGHAGQRRSLSVGCRPGVITDRADFIYADPYLSAAFGRRLTFYHQK